MRASEPGRPFGRLITAMVSPFTAGGELALDTAAELAAYLVDVQRNDTIIVNGTTGEGPTTSDAEKSDLIRAVRDAVGDRAQVVAGVGTYDTVHSVHLAERAERAGADGLLVVTPYYSKPPQEGLLTHFRAVAHATDLPVMLYDIPGRSVIAILSETLIKLAEHPNIVAVKDAKADLVASAQVMAATELAYYAGEDALLLPMLAIGAVGMVGTSTHFCGALTQDLIGFFEAGEVAKALDVHRQLLPIYTGIFRAQGTILAKAGLRLQGVLDPGPVRSPLVDATDAEVGQLSADLAAAGLA